MSKTDSFVSLRTMNLDRKKVNRFKTWYLKSLNRHFNLLTKEIFRKNLYHKHEVLNFGPIKNLMA